MVDAEERRAAHVGRGWIGVDFDGTLAEYHGWAGWNEFGPPIPAMVDRIRRWLAEGHDVRILTARMTTSDDNRYHCRVKNEWFTTRQVREALASYCATHIGQPLQATCVKDMQMIELWDDRAIQVVSNTGRSLAEEHSAEDQRAAGYTVNPEIVLGPPGTGKTTSLLNILDEELERGVPPDRIGYVSFTRKAADEAAQRACERFNLPRSDFPWFRTLHSLCFRRLGMRSAEVLEGPRMREFADYARVRITGRWSEDGTLTGFETGDRIMFMENLSRIRGISLREQYDLDDDTLPWREVERVSRALAAFKAAKGYMDYTDMLSEFVRMDTPPQLEVLLVDEAQDLSALQWRVVWLLARHARRVVVAGDDDQAIYRWAGADVDALIDMQGDARVLGKSWRCPPVIQSLAGGIISNVARRREKAWAAREGTGTVDRVVDAANVDLSGEDILILARNEYILREQFEPALQRAGILYERRGQPSIPTKMMRAVTDWERLRRGEPLPVETLRELFEHMSSGRGVKRGHKKLPGWEDTEEGTLSGLVQQGILLTQAPWYEALDRLPQDQVSYMRSALARGESPRKRPRIRLSTIHGSKGGEADHVILSTEIAQRTWREMDAAPEDEARVWYVGVTRARERLTIVGATTPRACPWL